MHEIPNFTTLLHDPFFFSFHAFTVNNCLLLGHLYFVPLYCRRIILFVCHAIGMFFFFFEMKLHFIIICFLIYWCVLVGGGRFGSLKHVVLNLILEFMAERKNYGCSDEVNHCFHSTHFVPTNSMVSQTYLFSTITSYPIDFSSKIY